MIIIFKKHILKREIKMYLSKIEEKMYNGEFGFAIEKSMKILVAIGDIYNAEKLIPIKNAQISGVSYKTIGDSGIKWISSMQEKVRVDSFLNPCGIDLKNNYDSIKIKSEFKKKQLKIINIFKNMDVKITCTCTPYYLPKLKLNIGDHIAWGESSAVSYVNSIYGCRTNREGGPSSLASAIIGKTPYYGLHISENRKPTIRFVLKDQIRNLSDLDYNILGLIIGKISNTNIPLIIMKNFPSFDNLKSLGASMAASGCVSLYHIPKITAEYRNALLNSSNINESIEITKRDLIDYKENTIYKKIDRYTDKIDLIVLGCPHCSEEEIIYIEKKLHNKKIKKELMIFVSRSIYKYYYKLIKNIRLSNAKVICDTCIIVSEICDIYNNILVNSGKAYIYIPTICHGKVFLGTIDDCLEESLKT